MPMSASVGSAPKPAGAGRLALHALWGRRLFLTISFALTIATVAVCLFTFVAEKPTPIFAFISDGPASVYKIRCQKYLFAEPEASWDGVYTLSHT